MRKRSWLVETCRAVLFGVVLIAFGYGWHVWHKSQECYDRIRVGMSRSETGTILKDYGYEHAGRDGNASELVLVYKRNKTEAPIVLTFRPNGFLTAKEQHSTVEHILDSIDDALR